MTAIFDPVGTFARLEQQNNQLELLPERLNKPSGVIYTNFVILRVVFGSRKILRQLVKSTRDSEFGADQTEDHAELAVFLASLVRGMRRHLARLEAMRDGGSILPALVTSYGDLVDDYSDLSETAALAADPEISELATKLSDALRGPRQSGV